MKNTFKGKKLSFRDAKFASTNKETLLASSSIEACLRNKKKERISICSSPLLDGRFVNSLTNDASDFLLLVRKEKGKERQRCFRLKIVRHLLLLELVETKEKKVPSIDTTLSFSMPLCSIPPARRNKSFAQISIGFAVQLRKILSQVFWLVLQIYHVRNEVKLSPSDIANTYNLSHARTIKSGKFKNQKDLFSTRVNIFFQKYLHRCDARFFARANELRRKLRGKKSSELRLFVTSLASLFFLCPTKIKRREALHDDTCSTKIGQRNNRLSKYYF